jgi:acyl-CoA dehydrogenase
MDTLGFFRPSVGAAAVGFATRALEESIQRARGRRQFGAPIGSFQAIQFYIAEMATDLDAARLLVFRAARMRDEGETEGAGRASAMAKLAATELAQGIVDKAVQIHGGTGVLVGSTVERLYREVRALRIYEGTSEIQKIVIARELLGKL